MCYRLLESVRSFVGSCEPTTLQDNRSAVDVLVIRESLKKTDCVIRWAPTSLQLADGLTKDKGEAVECLRRSLRSGPYMLRSEEQVMHERELSRTSKKLEDKLTVEQSYLLPLTPLSRSLTPTPSLSHSLCTPSRGVSGGGGVGPKFHRGRRVGGVCPPPPSPPFNPSPPSSPPSVGLPSAGPPKMSLCFLSPAANFVLSFLSVLSCFVATVRGHGPHTVLVWASWGHFVRAPAACWPPTPHLSATPPFGHPSSSSTLQGSHFGPPTLLCKGFCGCFTGVPRCSLSGVFGCCLGVFFWFSSGVLRVFLADFVGHWPKLTTPKLAEVEPPLPSSLLLPPRRVSKIVLEPGQSHNGP